MIYLDHNATTPPSAAAIEAVSRALTDLWPNPSSGHREGQRVRHAVESARASVAALLGAKPRDITFTSGGTESIHLAIRGVLAASPPERRTLITTPVEHEAIRDLADHLSRRTENRIEVRILPVDSCGLVDPAALADALDESVALVTIQWANNETGAIQPIAELGALCREATVPFHCDGTQWVGKMPTDVAATPVDMVTFSAHKFHGPKGIGGLYVRSGVHLAPIFHGAQERLRRAGTENVPGILGLGAAAEEASRWLADSANIDKARAVRDALEHGLTSAIPDAHINAPGAPRLWNTVNIGFPRLEAEALVLVLSEKGVCASAGAACASGSLDPSPVLRAMGIPDPIAHGSIRLSISRYTTEREITEAIPIIADAVRTLSRSAASVV